MLSVHGQFEDYALHHRTRGNKLCHRVGIPLIMLSLLGMLARVEFGPIDLAMVLILAAEIYYLALEWRLGLIMALASIAMYLAGSALPMWLLIVLFVAGWIFQFIGHGVYEKQRPAFYRNFAHLLIGPLWIVNDVVQVVRQSTQ